MASRIRRRAARQLPDDLSDDIHPVLRRVYARRDIATARDLDLRLSQLAPPEGMVDLYYSAKLLAEALCERERICIVGDFDADGATATALLVTALRDMADCCGGDRQQITFLIPDRFELGYGLSPEVVERVRPWAPKWLVTVDNGVSSNEGVAAANAAGMRVIVTDHHSPGEHLPAAEAIVNPKRQDDNFISANLAGVGIAFYLAAAMRSYLQQNCDLTDELPNVADLLDLVAVGTVADLVSLDTNNRILVEQGLRRIRARRARPGIYALLEQSQRKAETLVANDLAFAVGPKLNAAGRMDDMTAGVDCLLSKEADQARSLALKLNSLNSERREVESRMTDEALEEIDQRVEDIGLGLCVSAAGWHQGVVGILAARLKERYQCPAIAFAPGIDGTLRGSARSIPGLHIRDLLAAIKRDYPRLIERFGGHAMAAGLTIAGDKYNEFREAFAAALHTSLGGELPQQEYATDGELSSDEINMATAMALRYGGPWGIGFPEPKFDGVFSVCDQQQLRGGHLRLTLGDEASAKRWEAIAFGAVEKGYDKLQGRVRVVYSPDVREFRGKRSLQLRLDYMEPA
ncbi:single-stranded-DNA-specific exonuclease RecJ [Halorhodospira halochloris]|uniref:single-stranded-DNA-specific exonuclease RecJ n=1 Tax=Halorhodospira halochloris TaxID=1052 RepID=UPI001EE883D2|nr:single-stranded-DNA-specific exonuclease RecJ [Halorhodospira halochloris]